MPQKSRAQRLNGLFPLSYTGVVPVSPVNFVMDTRAPTVNDSKNFYLGDMWLNTSSLPATPPKASDLWMLVSLVGNIATWIDFGAGNLETLTGNSGGPVAPDGADNINVVGDGIGITIVGNPATNTLTASLVGGGSAASSFPTDAGTATPAAGVLNIIAGVSSSNAGKTVQFAGFGNTVELSVSDGDNNTLVGLNSGQFLSPGVVGNTGLGVSSLNSNPLGLSGSYNTAVGISAGEDITGSSFNTIIGAMALMNGHPGDNNFVAGYQSAVNWTGGEDNNIIIANPGVPGDSDIIRIGTEGSQTEAFMAGIAGVSVANQLPVVINSATGQLGTGAGTPSPMCGFGAYKSADSNNVTGDGTFYTVIYDTVVYDLDSNYNGGTGVFTAPTDGTYHFDTYIQCHNISDQSLSGILIVTTAVSFHSDLQSPVNDKQADNILHYQLSIDTEMSAGDTCFVQISLGGGSDAKTVGVSGAPSPIVTYFNGHRLDPAASFITGTETFITDAGTATPNILGQVNVLGGTGISTTGAGNTVTANLDPIPSFAAYLSTSANNVTGDSTVYTIIFDTALYDNLGDYNTGTGVFTAPVTGTYFFQTAISCQQIIDQTDSSCFITTTNATFEFGLLNPGAVKRSDNIVTFLGSVTLDMTAGDTASVAIAIAGGGSSKTIKIGGQSPPASPIITYFSANLVH